MNVISPEKQYLPAAALLYAEFCGTIKLTRGDACMRRHRRCACAKFAPNFCRSYFDFILSDNFAVLTWCVCVVRAWKQFISALSVLSNSSQHVVETVWCLGEKSGRRLRSAAVIVKVSPTFDLSPDTPNNKSAGCSLSLSNGHSAKVLSWNCAASKEL